MRLLLASASPRRAALLETLGLEFEVIPADLDETRFPDEMPTAYVERLARAKAAAVVEEGTVVVGADTVVVHDSRVLGKPIHPDQARSMLASLQGNTHDVITGVAVCWWDGGPQTESLVDSTEVTMTAMTEGEIDRYVMSGEPMDKAGAYAIQESGGQFVETVTGSPFTVVGLPVHLLRRLVARSGTDIDAFRT